ncbi:MAG: LPS export ABC transporter permease LptG, partial [bacterium]
GDMKNDFTFKELLYNLLLTMPGRIYEMIPAAALVGCIVGLGSMASGSELVVMRANGISVMRIVGFVLQPVLVLILIGLVLGEYIVPVSEQYAASRKIILRSSDGGQELESGLWNKEGNEFMHFNAVYPGGVVYGVSRYHFDSQNRLQQASFAQRASFKGDHWLEENGKLTTFLGDRTVVSSFETRRWNSSLDPELLQLFVLPPDFLGIRNLYQYVSYLDRQKSETNSHRLALWTKVLQPLTIASLVLLAISFVFGPLRSVTMGFRVFIGVIVGVVFSTLQSFLGPASQVFGFPPLLAVLIPSLVIAAVGLVLLRRAA